MQKHFYSHLIEIDSLYVSLDLLEMQPEERKELILIIDSSIHHVVLDTVLSELSEEDKKIFLSHLAEERHEDIWDLLKNKVKNVETKIKKSVDKLKNEFQRDIEKVKKKTSS